jgi:GntR family transcriptional repressor for pyruvate dehydrogenase complex
MIKNLNSGGKPSMISISEMRQVTRSVMDQIIAMVMRGVLKAGDKLPPLPDLAALFRVSEGELQNALVVLEVLGMVEAGTDGYALVRNATETPLNSLLFGLVLEKGSRQELYELRLIFDLGALELAIAKATSDDIQDLADHLRKYEARMIEGDLQSLARLDELFHLRILEMSQNPSFIKIGKTVMQLFALPLEKAVQSIGPEQILSNHRKLYNAIVAKDYSSARELMTRSFRKTMENF